VLDVCGAKEDKRALEKIRNLLEDPVAEVRSDAAAVLILLNEVDEEVMSVLVGDPSWDVRRQVAVELIRAGVADGANCGNC
jgi:HEAT repeat protein